MTDTNEMHALFSGRPKAINLNASRNFCIDLLANWEYLEKALEQNQVEAAKYMVNIAWWLIDEQGAADFDFWGRERPARICAKLGHKSIKTLYEIAASTEWATKAYGSKLIKQLDTELENQNAWDRFVEGKLEWLSSILPTDSYVKHYNKRGLLLSGRSNGWLIFDEGQLWNRLKDATVEMLAPHPEFEQILYDMHVAIEMLMEYKSLGIIVQENIRNIEKAWETWVDCMLEDILDRAKEAVLFDIESLEEQVKELKEAVSV